MALSCTAECALSLACARWLARRLSLSGADDSASWPTASSASFAPVPRACRAALAAYDDDEQPGLPSSSPLCPPYRLLHDRARGEVVLAVRGLASRGQRTTASSSTPAGPSPSLEGMLTVACSAPPMISCPELRHPCSTFSDLSSVCRVCCVSFA
ncbi:unnamed protein product [Miscanthus lutarioriparius]|uniref:Mono-/di-acylglycerol lipase N-terminal domain-containing protein n=1 Tax=Miscanthus lutarioriparius TaxID=422564 RepID=A0A811MVL5_9POAL|nr:unnamed protein product [Miscanthus lutarioriparius]